MEGNLMENTLPRLRWLVSQAWVTYLIVASVQGDALGPFQDASWLATIVVILVLTVLRAAVATLDLDFDKDEYVHTMSSRRPVRRRGLWEKVW